MWQIKIRILLACDKYEFKIQWIQFRNTICRKSSEHNNAEYNAETRDCDLTTHWETRDCHRSSISEKKTAGSTEETFHFREINHECRSWPRHNIVVTCALPKSVSEHHQRATRPLPARPNSEGERQPGQAWLECTGLSCRRNSRSAVPSFLPTTDVTGTLPP